MEFLDLVVNSHMELEYLSLQIMNLDTLEQLYDIGCDEIQVFFISKPLSKEDFEKFCVDFNRVSHKDSFIKEKM